ncbi:MAG: hypothetical protein U9Q20_04490 [Campylobacterota bacterium]|nr:hypothetical protein [Campylobacterota bacterium]
MLDNEPTMNQIDDYNNNEPKEKRKTINFVIIGLLVISVVYGIIKFSFNDVDEYVGTPEKPGINTTKN